MAFAENLTYYEPTGSLPTRAHEVLPMVKDMAFVAYSVSDVPRASRFYQDVVGLQLGQSFGEHFVEFNVGSTTFAIDGEPPGIAPGSSSGAAFEVDDVVAMRALLVERGVGVTDVHESPVCYFAFATDPDGNGFVIHQRKSEKPAASEIPNATR